MKRLLIYSIALLLCTLLTYLFLATKGYLGITEGPGIISQLGEPAASINNKLTRQLPLQPKSNPRQILFGDLHVHTTLSTDAFFISLPMMGGEGTHPQGDACDYARYCSNLDFWSINDHASNITPTQWQDTIDSIRQCNAVNNNPDQPDTVAFLGWEWTQMGGSPATHYGHKNVILKNLERVPKRPISAEKAPDLPDAMAELPLGIQMVLALAQPNQRTYDLLLNDQQKAEVTDCTETSDAQSPCRERAATPAQLYQKLDALNLDSIVIPHGTAWGVHTPPGTDWRSQLNPEQHDPKRQTLIEVFSGHGNSEEYRSWRDIDVDKNGDISCPEPKHNYIPSCWYAGEIIRRRCLAENVDAQECQRRAQLTQQLYIERGEAGHLVVPGVSAHDWLNSGQCVDCFMPAFSLRPLSTVQYMMAISHFDDNNKPLRFRFGFMASSDNHRGRPGTGFKEISRLTTTEASGPIAGAPDFLALAKSDPVAMPEAVNVSQLSPFLKGETERNTSFFGSGGLIAVQSHNRSRDGIWQALQQRAVYGTSGDRILLWFNAQQQQQSHPMGAEFNAAQSPQFTVKAAGAFLQKPGCPDYSVTSLSPERLNSLCGGECYNPSDTRKTITRLEVIRIRPQQYPGEPVDQLINDPWLVHPCPAQGEGCSFSFSDPDFNRDQRDALYYVRAIQSPSEAINGGRLRCEYDAQGQCIKVNICSGADATTSHQDDCTAAVEERAWSSPIFVNFQDNNST